MIGETPDKTCIEEQAYSKWEDGELEYFGGYRNALKTTAQQHWTSVAQFCNTIGNYSCSLAYYVALQYSLNHNPSQETVFVHANRGLKKEGKDRRAEQIFYSITQSVCGTAVPST